MSSTLARVLSAGLSTLLLAAAGACRLEAEAPEACAEDAKEPRSVGAGADAAAAELAAADGATDGGMDGMASNADGGPAAAAPAFIAVRWRPIDHVIGGAAFLVGELVIENNTTRSLGSGWTPRLPFRAPGGRRGSR